ncbi:Iron(3+)-hydroxamate import system permease protein FhuB [Serratia grimesii]|jgi:iron complex transport system permease protein|uniref:Fe(3+)-hydroxamate ABC transporter permease FhuB n=1 Tax=Serratia grimesii TaxID=82995 RepID=UPI00076F3B91|nr:Fe(3+)-hydroxamate ABC transporter permease FhuB [Serratia grimesii]CAI1018636.1 Iron(III)-hydroxamate import system permease protein fhuB [Serratia grimesii]CAI1161238.1 Iron(III)-hydroxamate import system permease protein fhuB [Serratia grimesii]CAI2491387.1 Iron(III)-hydroxamate import system permease protein fhuB [Serratia grimesii]CUW23945.1 Iron(3+)-hydroxamate import system permease protein FhuB [Serratia grimesii]SMZ58417.1 Iron(3+)-hydroxamate import system permease protein FhuB [S
MNARIRALPVTLVLVLLASASGLTLYNLLQQLPWAQWGQALNAPDIDDVHQMLFHYSLLPRLSVSLLAGAGLGLVGVLFQQVLRNPLAEPATLGVSAGAQLGLTVATLWMLPGGELTRQLAAMVGAVVVGGLVFGVAWGKRMSPVTLILAGLVLGLYCGAVNSLLALFNYDQLQGVFLWSTGALNQQDWSTVQFILPRLLVAGLLAVLLLRPLTLLGLDDGVARNLGLGLSMARFCALAVAIIFSAMLVNAAGVIGFIGLFAPLMAKMLGARRLAHRMMLAPLLGALLLWLTDQVMIWLTQVWREVPTGAATALFGAPLLLWLLPRLRSASTPPPMNLGDKVPAERGHLLAWVALAGAVLFAGLTVALMFGQNAAGWHWSQGAELESLMPWRWPRVLSALAAGMMLAVAGTLIQKLTGNPMASPEVLGISSGAAFGVVMMLLVVPGDAFVWLLPAGSLGAAGTLLVIMIAAGRGGFSTERMLLAGIALSTAFTTTIFLLLASGDPRTGGLLTWISGSTYSVTPEQAVRTAIIAAMLIVLAPLCRRWLSILPLGSATARSVGIALTPVRLTILLLAATLTAMATLTVGPLSFIGLMAPHMARMLGFRRALPQMVISALLGGLLMVFADWCGRMVMFPYQIPAGLLATFIGAPYFVYLLRKQTS